MKRLVERNTCPLAVMHVILIAMDSRSHSTAARHCHEDSNAGISTKKMLVVLDVQKNI